MCRRRTPQSELTKHSFFALFTLLQASSVLYRYSSTAVADIINALSSFAETLHVAATMTRPVVHLHSNDRPHSKEVRFGQCSYLQVLIIFI